MSSVSRKRRRVGRAFTSAGDGLWSNPSTWSKTVAANGAYPRYPDDTVTIAAGHEVTIPAGLCVRVGAIALAAGTNTSTDRTKIINGGIHELAGNCTFAGIGSYEMTAGAILDLRGFTLTSSTTDNKFIPTGTSGARCKVKSTGARGIVSFNSNSSVFTADYTDFEGLGASFLGRSHGATPNGNHADHCTFSNMADWYFDSTNSVANASIAFTNNDIRNVPSAAAIQCGITFGSQAIGSGSRVFTGNSFSGGSFLGKIVITNVATLTFTDNIIDHCDVLPAIAITFANNFFSNTVGDDGAFEFGGSGITTWTNNYMYYVGGNHVFASQSNAVTATGNICEVPQDLTYRGANWFLYGAASVAITLQNNIFLGAGTPLSLTAAAAPTIDFSNNTWYGNNFSTSVSSAFADFGMFETEQSAALSGTFNYYNNIVAVKDTSTIGGNAVINPHITLRNAVGSQITSANYNGKTGYASNGSYDAAASVGYWENRGAGQIAGLGANDVSADPLFADKAAALATWDASLGGPGTAANAITEMLRVNSYGAAFNSAYSITALLAYVKAGFQPSGAGATAYNGTGLAGANIGFR